MTVTLQRLIGGAMVLALALAVMLVAPRPAQAHVGGCGPTQQSASDSGVLATVAHAINVYQAVLQIAEGCEPKYADVDAKIERDFVVEGQVGAQRGAGQGGERTFAPCVRGMAAGTFPCDGIDMLSHVSHAELGTTFVNDIWGWTDPEANRDYALVGAIEGTVFVDITNPLRPQVLGILPAHTLDPNREVWRDIKVFDDHAFVVSEATGHGIQVFDLTQLRDWDGTYTTYENTAHYDGHGSAHNININEDTGFAYSVGARASDSDPALGCGTGLHMIDVNDPTAPTFAGCFQTLDYVHDTQCVIYEGPDADHRGRELCFNSTPSAPGQGHTVSIVDVTDKANPVSLSSQPYDAAGYSHQGWLTPDQRFFLHGDELDEFFGEVDTTTTRVWDVSDLDDPQLVDVFTNGATSIDHNVYTHGDRAYASNYTSGLRIFDTSEPADMEEVGFFDIYPENDDPTFEGGTWSNYAEFRRPGVVAVSSIDRGLFILRPRGSVR